MEEEEKKYKDWSEMTDEELDASMPEPRPQNRYEEEALENREKRKRRAEAFRDFFYENLWQRKHADDMLDFCQKLTKPALYAPVSASTTFSPPNIATITEAPIPSRIMFQP